MFGYERGALIGQSIELLVPHRLLDRHTHHRRDPRLHGFMQWAQGLRHLVADATVLNFPLMSS
jgi:hypothetical protein